jgi:hypothetical protein
VTETHERSEQLPEEAPAEQVHDDAGGSGADHSPGVPGEEGTATGNPDAAGAEGEGDATDEEGDRADEEGLAGA